MKPEAGRTLPDEIPPVHVLQAAHHQERKETEDLLAGFDVPGRGPKKPARERDFVDYYTKKKGDDVANPLPTGPRQIDVATVVKARHELARRPPVVWVTWLGLAVLMLGIGGLVAFLATEEPRPSARAPAGSGAATITAATPPPPEASRRDVIPAPEPAPPTAAVAPSDPPPPSRPTLARPRSSTASVELPASAGDPRKPPPRDDFIRDM